MSEIVNNLDIKANEFVMEYKNASDEEISKIVAGMVAIIEGNEATYERMKNQKWFERIWYGLTLKNKATVKEMRARREELTEFTVKILVRMNEILADHSRCIFDLYRAVAVIRRDIDVLTDQVAILAKKLNEKIASVDQYYFLICQIRNHKFNSETPLLSLINIMSFVDSRTSKEKAKLIQLKETMEVEGFDFSREINVSDYANEVLSLPEESVGRILLFCQSFANRSRLLAFTCSLMENYYFQWESEKHLSKVNGEAFSEALMSNNLHDSDSCIVGELFDDLIKALPDEFDAVKVPSIEAPKETPASYFSRKSDKTINIVVTGKVGAGKTTLINSIFGWNCEMTGEIKQSISRYTNDEDSICFYETAGFYFDAAFNDKIIRDIEKLKSENMDLVMWYCVNSLGGRLDDESLICKLHNLDIPIVIVLTQSIIENDSLKDVVMNMIEDKNYDKMACVTVIAKEYEKPTKLPSEGLEELMDCTIEMCS